MKITKKQLRRIIKETMDGVTPEIWADQYGLDTDVDNDGQIIIYLDADQASRVTMPPGVDWDATENYDEQSWTIYTGEYDEEGGVWSDEKDYEAGFKS